MKVAASARRSPISGSFTPSTCPRRASSSSWSIEPQPPTRASSELVRSSASTMAPKSGHELTTSEAGSARSNDSDSGPMSLVRVGA